MTDDLISFDQAGRLANVSRETVKYWVKTGRLAGIPTATTSTGKPYRFKVRRSELFESLTGAQIRELEKKIGSKLLTNGQIAQLFNFKSTLSANSMLITLGVRKYKIHNYVLISREELLQAMEDHPYYYEFIPVLHMNEKIGACGCDFCLAGYSCLT